MFQFHFMFVKLHDVPPLLCVSVQTEMKFRLKQFLFYNAYPLETVIRIICWMKPRDSCESKYSEPGVMRFSDINVYTISKFMFRVCKGEVPNIFGTYFKANSEVHSHFTRQCNYFHLPVVKNNRAKANIRDRGAVMLNRIFSCGIDPDIFEAVFVKLVKQIIVNGVLNM